MEKKGTVTPISSMFSPEEAQKASKQVLDTIAERKQQLVQLKGFIDDNINIMNLVQKLPEETHHNIMVPFGKAAFFPGRLIHTNEFMVLLGEGYYAERTSKQTAEILKRRGKALELQVESLKAIMQDLKAEASFFDATAQESVEGLVEIREDYVEEDSPGKLPIAGDKKYDASPFHEVDDTKAADEDEDEEYARILSRMAELEKEEEEAEKTDESDEDEQMQNVPVSHITQVSNDQEVRHSPVDASEVPAASKDVSSHGNHPALTNSMKNKSLELPPEKNKVQAPLMADDNMKNKGLEPPPEKDKVQALLPADNRMMNKVMELPQEKKKVQAPPTASNMAFTGSIVEHDYNIGTNFREPQTGSHSSKPVSRFKMQRK